MCTETVSSEIRWDEAPFYSNDVPIFVFIVVVVVVVGGGGGGGGGVCVCVCVCARARFCARVFLPCFV